MVSGWPQEDPAEEVGLSRKERLKTKDAPPEVVAGIGLEALPPVREAIGSGFETKTITLSCGKLTTGVTVPQCSSILMLRNLKSPETYFQAAFRVQSPWSI